MVIKKTVPDDKNAVYAAPFDMLVLRKEVRNS